jgi:hypothetical protein
MSATVIAFRQPEAIDDPLSRDFGRVLGAPLPLAESILIAWPHTVGMVASAILVV